MHVVTGGGLLSTVRNTVAFNLEARRLTRQSAARAGGPVAERVAAFNARRIVLTVTSGRTGTDTVSKLFGYLPDTASLHEPNPNHRFILNRVQSRPEEAAWFFWHLQAPALLERIGANVVETSHLFCKGFFEPCIAAGFRPNILFMERETRAVAQSLLLKNAVPGRTGAGYRYLIAPDDEPYLPVENAEGLSDYQLCYWYALEIEERQRLYAELAAELGLTCATIATPELSDAERLVQTVTALELADEATAREAVSNMAVGKAYNATPRDKLKDLAIDADAEEEALSARLGASLGRAELDRRIARAKSYL